MLMACHLLPSDQSKTWKIHGFEIAVFQNIGIRSFIGPQCQHIKLTLIDAGSHTGLSINMNGPGARPPHVQIRMINKQPYDWKLLIERGFTVVGEWSLNGEQISLSGPLPSIPGVYVFVLNDEVVYVGLSQKNLKNRMDGYRIGNSHQKTNARVKKAIKSALSDGKRLRVLMYSPGNTDWNNLPVHIAPGLEAGLIELIQPAWNIQGRSN